jgi:RYK receptor-like tyrosine kinase
MALISILTIFLLAFLARSKYNKKPKVSQPSRTTSFQRLQTHPPSQAPSVCATATLPRSKSGDPDELRRRISEITVERCRVRLSSLVQEGTFGRVYRGTYNEDENVLVKTVGQHASQIQVSLLLQEGMGLYGASHPHILSVLGVSIEDHTAPLILYPAESNTKNLKVFLLEPVARTLTTIQSVEMCLQVASAIGHLHSHGVLHKDIATRNCM